MVPLDLCWNLGYTSFFVSRRSPSKCILIIQFYFQASVLRPVTHVLHPLDIFSGLELKAARHSSRYIIDGSVRLGEISYKGTLVIQ